MKYFTLLLLLPIVFTAYSTYKIESEYTPSLQQANLLCKQLAIYSGLDPKNAELETLSEFSKDTRCILSGKKDKVKIQMRWIGPTLTTAVLTNGDWK